MVWSQFYFITGELWLSSEAPLYNSCMLRKFYTPLCCPSFQTIMGLYFNKIMPGPTLQVFLLLDFVLTESSLASMFTESLSYWTRLKHYGQGPATILEFWWSNAPIAHNVLLYSLGGYPPHLSINGKLNNCLQKGQSWRNALLCFYLCEDLALEYII